jgi:hypothetical protein
VIITAGFVVGTVGLIISSWPTFWAGAALVPVGAIVGKVMQAMGLGAKGRVRHAN